MAIGAAYTDVNFYSGPGEMTLVLAPPDNTAPQAIRTL